MGHCRNGMTVGHDVRPSLHFVWTNADMSIPVGDLMWVLNMGHMAYAKWLVSLLPFAPLSIQT